MSASKKKIKKCCRRNLVVFLIFLSGLSVLIISTTPEFREEKKLWMEQSIQNVPARQQK